MFLLYDLTSQQDTALFAQSFAGLLKPSDIVAIKGDLGAGKTFLCKHIISSLLENAAPESVTSPTFNILQLYDNSSYNIFHFDLYRLKSAEEFFELGIEDAFAKNAISLIEWPELIEPFLPYDVIRINISIGNNSDEHREIKIESTEENITRIKSAILCSG